MPAIVAGMANFLAEIYEELKAAYTAVLTGITDGSRVVQYKLRDRIVEREPSDDLLRELSDQIAQAEKQINRSSSSIFRVASLSRPSRRG